MRASLLRAALLLTGASGCAALAGITDLESDEAPDAAPPPPPPPEDAKGDAAVDAGADAPLPAPDAEAGRPFRYVFITSGGNDGDLGGTAGADGKCMAAAALGGRPGEWVAWISGDGKDAIDRIDWDGEYRLLGEEAVVTNKTQLASGTLTRAIDIDEKGLPVQGSADEKRVWTGTMANGNGSGASCASWTNGFEGTGTFGRATVSTAGWTSAGTTSCVAEMHLYCFEKR